MQWLYSETKLTTSYPDRYVNSLYFDDIYYNTIQGTLANNTNPVYIHIGHSGWQGVDDYAMTYEPSLGNGWWSFVYPIAEDAETIDFVFTDLLDNWDNNGGIGIGTHR